MGTGIFTMVDKQEIKRKCYGYREPKVPPTPRPCCEEHNRDITVKKSYSEAVNFPWKQAGDMDTQYIAWTLKIVELCTRLPFDI